MNKSKYIDVPSIMQVIGGVYLNPAILDEDEKYFFNKEDFPEEFHRILFGVIHDLYKLGSKKITPIDIENYLESRPKKFAIYKNNKGEEYLNKLSEITQLSAFDYYYNKMKKMTLLREYSKIGMDLSWLYDPDNILDVKKKQLQEDWLDNTPLIDIADTIDKKIEEIKLKYIDDADLTYNQAGDGIDNLLEGLQRNPEIGYPLADGMFNSVCRGARLGKFYLRSAATGVGKTRSMVADFCSIGCDELYDINKKEWVKNNTKEPVLYIVTEQELDEIQTMMIAYIANVDEDHILYNNYIEGEYDRVLHAAELIKNCNMYVKRLPDFSLQDIENTIKIGIREYGAKYVFFDYIHSSIKILSEVSSRAGVKGLREDNVLFMISVKLKDLCTKYGIFLLSSTQLNGDYKQENENRYDQNMLRGAKAIADKIDFGAIMLETTEQDKESLAEVLKKGEFEMPDIKISIYKNRRGRYKSILLWCKADRGTCRITSMFATTYNYELVQINELKINIKKPEASAF